jgi:hypothetical protein
MHRTFQLEDLKGNHFLLALRHRWEEKVKMDPRDIGCERTNWNELVQDKVQCQTSVNTVIFNFKLSVVITSGRN